MKKLITFLCLAFIANISIATVTFTPTAIDTGYCKHYYSCKVTASGGVAPYKYAISSGTLPAGLYLSKINGKISGTISLTDDTAISFTVRAIDSSNDTATKAYTMYVRNKVLTWGELADIWSLQPNTFPSYSNVYDTYRMANPADLNSVKTFTALLTQTGTAAPSAIVLKNTIGGTISWTRDDVGNYLGTLSEGYEFTTDKTTLIVGLNYTGFVSALIEDTDRIRVITADTAGTFTDALLDKAPIEIKIY